MSPTPPSISNGFPLEAVKIEEETDDVSIAIKKEEIEISDIKQENGISDSLGPYEKATMMYLESVKKEPEDIDGKDFKCDANVNQEDNHPSGIAVKEYKATNPKFNKFRCNLWIIKIKNKIKFQTNYKGSLNDTKRHLNVDDIEHYVCETCQFSFKHKKHLEEHLKWHLLPVERFRCETCGYQTKLKKVFKRHKKTHLPIEELENYQCKNCLYRTVHAAGFKRHLLLHKTPDE